MGVGVRFFWVALVAWAVTPTHAFARVPKSAAPVPAASTAVPVEAEPAPEARPDVEPSTVGAAETAASSDDAHLNEDAAEAAPSTVDMVLSNRQVQTVVSLFGRGVTVNDDVEEPPLAPVSVRVRPTKRAGASLSVCVRF